MKTILTPLKWITLPTKESRFCDAMIELERVEDETWGEVLEIKRSEDDVDPWRISKTEWPSIRAAINKAIKHCVESECE